MRRSFLIMIVGFACCHAPTFAGEPATGDNFPVDFKQRAFEHIAQLASFGPRSPGAAGEEPAFHYVLGQFEQTGLDVRIERFDYEFFRIEQLDFTACGERIEPETIGFDPYGGPYVFGGTPLLLGPEKTGNDLDQLDLRNRIVVTTSPVDYFSLIFRGPQLIVYVSNSHFTRLVEENCSSCSLAVKGTIETRTSANIVAELASKTPNNKEVIISAHWDSYRNSPGADDNGSGVGALIELARFFSTFEGDIGGSNKFVSFGAEELGVVGSRAYLNTHHEDLRDCVLVFNMDQVGGPKGPTVEILGGVQGIPESKGTTQFPPRVQNRSFEGLDGVGEYWAPT